MYQPRSAAFYTREQRFNDKLPLSIVASLAVIQMLTTLAIFAFEIGHNILNIYLTNLFVGFWTSVPFTILWISMFALVCCCRRRNCATHAVVQNILGIIFASILIAINIAFIRRPNECFFTDGICQRLNWVGSIHREVECLFDTIQTNCAKNRMALIKAQLAAGVLMIVTCLIYLIIYTVVAVRAAKATKRALPSAPDPVIAPVYHQPQLHPYEIPAYPYQPPTPIVNKPYQQVAPANYMPPAQHPSVYPTLANDRF